MKARTSTLPKRTTAGFTLFELVLYMALSVVVVGLMSGIGLRALEGKTYLAAQEDVTYSAYLATTRIQSAIQEGTQIVSPEVGTSATTLTITATDPERDPIHIGITDGAITQTFGDDVPIRLTTEGVRADDMSFRVVGVGASTLVSYEFSLVRLRGDGTSYGTTTRFSSTVSLPLP